MKSADLFSKDKKTKRFLWSRIATILVALIAIIYFFPHPEADNNFRYEVGRPWQYDDLIAPFDINVPRDSVEMRQKLDSLNSEFVYHYVRNTDLNIDTMLLRTSEYYEAKKKGLAPIEGQNILDDTRINLAINNFERTTANIIRKYYGKENIIIEDENGLRPKKIAVKESQTRVNTEISNPVTISDIIDDIAEQASKQGLSQLVEDGKLKNILEPTFVKDEVTNTNLYTGARNKIESDTYVVLQGQTIIQKGNIVTPRHDAMLKAYQKKSAEESISSNHSMLTVWIGQGLYVCLIIGLFVFYIIVCEPKVWRNIRSFSFVIGSITVFFVVSAIMSRVLALGLYTVPLVIAPILVLVFFNGRLALWTGVTLAMLTGAMATFGFEFISLQVTATAIAVFTLRDLTQRSQLLKTAAYIGLMYIACYVAVQMLTNGTFDGITMRMIGVLALNAALTSMAYVLMFGVERMFGFVSNVTLVELTDVNAPLLRALSDECPGTFNHVIAVANLAGDAARQIGANVLLTRAGAMYHDIGKLSNPMFFTENQHGVNPHDGLSPLKSAEIIINHVTDGLRRAEKAGLPPVIRDFITEHHGAGQAKYFYFTYCKQHPDEKIDPTPFTYPGPNPRTRETSILMMADAVEAASRSLKEYTPKAISDLVNKIIDGQIADGLHNNSPLSFNDIRTIKDAFTRRLMTMYHSRIAYPDDPNKKS